MTNPGPEAILEALTGHGVEFVVIGGLAAVAHGSRRMTRDIDVVVSPDDENLTRLEAALRDLGAVQLVEHPGEKEIEPADIAMIALGTTLHTTVSGGAARHRRCARGCRALSPAETTFDQQQDRRRAGDGGRPR